MDFDVLISEQDPTYQHAAIASKRTITLLLIVHQFIIILSVIICAYVADSSSWYTISLSIGSLYGGLYCQGSLLAFWFAFSRAAWWKRCLGIALGLAYLWILERVGTGDGFHTFRNRLFCLRYGVCAFIVIILVILRKRGMTLHQFPGSPEHPARSRPIFSIRSLMVSTLFLGLIFEIAIVLRRGDFRTGMFHSLITWNISYVVTGILAMWATLGLALPTFRLAIFIAAALLMCVLDIVIQGKIVAYSVIIPLIIYAAMMVASFLVLRSGGYRLVSRSGGLGGRG
jgi:hypothetical protein